MLILFGVFELFAAGRVFVEMRVLDDNNNPVVAAHRFLWYTSVFLFFAACYRRILRAPFEKLMYLSLGGVILFIPPLYAIIGGYEFRMNYLVSNDPAEIVRELLTLHYGHEKNFLMFPELFTLLVGTAGISWYFSRSVPRTLLNTVVAFYGAFLFAGLCWFSVEESHDAVWRFAAMFRAQQFYALQFLGAIVVLSALLFLPELKGWFERSVPWRRTILPGLLFCLTYIVFEHFIAPRHNRPLMPVDLAVITLPALLLSFAPSFIADRAVPAAGRIYAGWFALFALLLMAGVLFLPVRL
jgi:hypothetical protein